MKHIRRNPFICGGPVPSSHFVGREREIRTIFDQIASPARGCVAISGGRRMGKTSLLQYTCDSDVIQKWGLSPDEYFFVYLDCPSIGSFTPSRFWQRILTLLSRQAKEKSLTSLVETIEDVLEKETISALDFETVLDEIHRKGRTLALLLDEFEWVVDPRDKHTTHVFLSNLRALNTRQPRVLSLVVVTREELRKLCRPIKFTTSPFYNNFLFRHLKPLTEKEIKQLLEKTLERTGIEFSPEERKCIRELGGTHPYLIQQAGSVIFDTRVQGLEVAACLERINSEFEEQTRHHFVDVWEDSGPRERVLLILIALCGLARREEERTYDVKTLQHILNRDERAMRSLANRGLITKARPTATLSPLTFELWVLEEIKSWDNSEFAEYASLMFDLLAIEEAEYAVEAMQLASGRKSAEPESARKIGRYEIIEKLGSGAMSIVHKAHDPKIGRPVALKVIRGSSTQSDELKKRFRREAISAGQLRHSNIVTIHDTGEDKGRPFIVMEYLEGPTLAQVLRTESSLPLERVISIVGQVGNALDYAHQQGVIHRDIKPSNIFLLESDQVKVADFGLAKLTSAPDPTPEGKIIGTPGYASPEQLLGQKIDGRADIFSLGIVIYEMLTGKKPIEEDVVFMIKRAMAKKPLAFEALDSELLPGIKEILLKATAEDVNERYQTCAELKDALESITQKLAKNRRSSVFISYSSADRDFVEKLASDLRTSGIGVWFDKWEIKIGDSFIQRINDGLHDNDYLAIVLSPTSVKSRWVRKELSAALVKELEESRSVVVLPILYKDCDIPPLIAGKHYADFREDYERGLKEILAVLAPE